MGEFANEAELDTDTPSRNDEDLQGLEELLSFIRDSRGFDFTGYKRTSLARRMRKRMQEVGVEDWLDYRDRLELDADEFRQLFNTILINVTSFFRDRESWQYFQKEVIPQILADSPPGSEIRIWSAGCSGGQEPYSLAIMWAEALGLDEFLDRVKIYATDVDEEALRDARAGLFAARDLEALTPELRERYFEPSGHSYAVRPDVRRRVIFGRHDLTRDAPISRLDLLVCRNTLMYFNVETQTQIIDRLHFALRDNGYLFLGKAEMLLADGERFEIVNMRHRLFRRRTGSDGSPPSPVRMTMQPAARSEFRAMSRQRELLELMVEGSPNAVVALDDRGIVLTASMQARAEFGLTTHDLGRPFRDLELSYRPVELRSLIEQAQHDRRVIRLSQVEWAVPSGDSRFYDIQVQPLWTAEGLAAGTAITFTDTTVQTRQGVELKRIREDLETAYEELQSTNEELETTNEELQSSNEELETMNEEMRSRTAELDASRVFLEAVLSSISAAVVVLSSDKLVESWNRAAEDMWGLRSSEVVGKSFFVLDFGLPTAELRDLVDQVLTTHESRPPCRPPQSIAEAGRSSARSPVHRWTGARTASCC